ncbi:Uncharacterized protein TPAR_01859, partial [Tolypocladium paradoxum]
MPSHHRSSANTGRRTHSNSPRQSPGSSCRLGAAPAYAPTDLIYAAQDYEETLLDELKDKNTELNKANSERDRYQHLYELANKKLSESHAAKEDLRAQVQGLREDNALLKERLEDMREEIGQLAYENEAWDKNYTVLEKNYTELAAHYNAVAASAPSSSSYRGATKLPERPKPSHKPSGSKEHREHREHRRSDKESKDQRDRLSRRFEEKRPTSSRSRRASFIEAWGPAGAGGPAP